MAIYTTYKNLEKPDISELYNINVANKNNDIIDSELHKIELNLANQNSQFASKQDLNSEISRATAKENEIASGLASEISRATAAENKNCEDLADETDRATTAENDIRNSVQDHINNAVNPHNVTKAQIGLENADNTSDMDKPVSTAQQNALDAAISAHNAAKSAHDDLRILISGLTTKLNALADSDDTTLDQLSEIVAYIKSNKSLIDSITTGKVNVSDIVDDLTSSFTDKPLSAKQGTILKGLITDLAEIVGNKVDKTGNAGTASKWEAARTIDGMSVQGDADRNTYGVCSTAASTVEKVASCPGFTLVTGSKIDVKFTITNTAASPTLNVNNTGAKAIFWNGKSVDKSAIKANHIYSFRYDGTNYIMVGNAPATDEVHLKYAAGKTIPSITIPSNTWIQIPEEYYPVTEKNWIFVTCKHWSNSNGTFSIHMSAGKPFINGEAGLVITNLNLLYFYFE